MPWRSSDLRIVDSNPPSDISMHQPLSLWWIALAAADETLQGGPMTTSWLRLFQNHLSTSDLALMRWRGDLAESAEMRRAYSAMYGRYFARALLASRLGFTDFVSLRRHITTIPSGVTVKRIAKGDIPDWIAWNPRRGGYVLAEAKGNLTGALDDFQNGTPACTESGKAQFDRVSVKDAAGTIISTRNWVVASLWSTDARPRIPISVLWDPPAQGTALPHEDLARHAAAIRTRKFNALAPRLSRSRLLTGRRSTMRIQISAQPLNEPAISMTFGTDGKNPQTDEGILPMESMARIAHSDIYVAALMTPLGITPIRSQTDIRVLFDAQRRAQDVNEPALIFGASIQSILEPNDRVLWLSGNGIAAPDGLSLFNLRDVKIERIGEEPFDLPLQEL